MLKNIIYSNTLIFLILIGCSKTTDKEYMVKAAEYVEQSNFAEAITAYEALVEKYPDSELAPEALIQMATIYHSSQVKNLSKEESLQKSANLFKTVYEKYPANDQAPQSLFMAGFIYANDLNDYSKATEAYDLFLEKYPGHELATSAKEELEYMGLTPEEILKKKIAAEK